MGTKRVQINVLDGISSKAEEFAWLEKVKDAAGENSYMAGLFSRGLLFWCEQQMRNDFTCDIMEYLRSTNEGLESLVRQTRELQQKYNDVCAENTRRDQRMTEMQNELEDAYITISNLNERERERGGKLVSAEMQYAEDLAEKDREIEMLLDTVTKLKARLFDLLDE